MFAAIGRGDDAVLDTMEKSCVPWLQRMLASGRYVGWITCDGETAVASAGMLILDWPPHPMDPTGEQRAYLLNVYVVPEYRKRGLARALVMQCMEEAHRKGIRVVTLHASDAGRPLYAELGFSGTNEMLFAEAEQAG